MMLRPTIPLKWSNDGSLRKTPSISANKQRKKLRAPCWISLGLSNARGEFVALLDADDLWFPTYLQRHVEAHLNLLVTAGISSSNTLQVDGKLRLISGTFNSNVWTSSGNDKTVQIPKQL